jgi:hypothetical protein
MKRIPQTINPVVNSAILSKIEEPQYLRQMLDTKGYSVARAVCEWFHYCKIKTHGKLPSVRNMSLERGIDAITKLLSIDAQDINDIILVLNFSLSDNFWKNNILAVGQLRAKNPDDKIMRYERILLKVHEKEGLGNDKSAKFDTGLKLL